MKSLIVLHGFKKRKNKDWFKTIGFSFHDGPELLEKGITGNIQNLNLFQIQINYLDWDSVGVQSRQCYEVADKIS